MLRRLKADEIEAAFQLWISSLIKKTGSDIIAIHGKTAGRSFTTKGSKNTLHLEKMSHQYGKEEPLVFNVMRKIALNLFKQDKTKSASIARKKKMAGLDDEFRSSLMEQGIKMR